MDKLKTNEAAALVKLKETLARDFSLVQLKLFGSKARGDSHPESDIDVLIVLSGYDWDTEKAVYDLCTDISIDFGVLVVPVLYSVSEFESELMRVTPFYQNVVQDGVSL